MHRYQTGVLNTSLADPTSQGRAIPSNEATRLYAAITQIRRGVTKDSQRTLIRQDTSYICHNIIITIVLIYASYTIEIILDA
jgi:hypothetical protein